MKKHQPHERVGWTVKQLRDIVSHQFYNGQPVHIDHDPPLWMRKNNTKFENVHPNDPRYCRFILASEHIGQKTPQDNKTIKKVRHVEKKHLTHVAAMSGRQCGDKRKSKGSIRSRGFNKRKK